MRKQLYTSLILLAILSLVGVVTINIFLPFMPGGVVAALVGLLIEFALIFLGVGTTILMGDVSPPPLVFSVVTIVGALSAAIYVYSLKISSLKVSVVALVVWAFVGTWSTFWGLAYGI